MDGQSELEILISANDEASAALAEIGESLSALGDQAGEASEQASTALDGIGETADSVGASVATSLSGAFDGVVTQASTAAGGVATALDGISTAADIDAAGITTAFDAAFSGMLTDGTADASELAAAFASSMDLITTDAAGAAADMSASLNGGSAMAGGAGLAVVGAGLTDGVKNIVEGGGALATANAQLGNTVSNMIANAGSGAKGAQTAIDDLKAKMAGLTATINENQASLLVSKGTTDQTAAAHEKAAATIATSQASYAQLAGELEEMTNQQNLAGVSVTSVVDPLNAAAEGAAQFGFNATDSTQALNYLFATTGSTTEALDAFNDAQNLSAKTGEPLSASANMVIQAMNGQGKSLRDLGIQVKDGLSGQTALDAINQKVAGSAALAATTGLGPMAVATAKWSNAMDDAGKTVLPIINDIAAALGKISDAFEEFATKNPKLAEAVLIVTGILGGFLLVIGGITLAMALLGPGLAVLGTIFGAIAVAVGVSVGAIVGIFAVFIAAIVAIIVWHQQIWDFIKEVWAGIEAVYNAVIGAITSYLKSELQMWENAFTTTMNAIKAGWELIWTGMSDFVTSIWTGIKNAVKAGIDDLIAPINAFIGAIDSIHISIPAVSILGIKTPALNLGFSIPQIPMLADGGVVTGPTLAMIGEAGPEMVIPLSAFAGAGGSLPGAAGSSGGNIVVNVSGTFPTDTSSVQQLSRLLAQQIQAQLRLKRVA